MKRNDWEKVKFPKKKFEMKLDFWREMIEIKFNFLKRNAFEMKLDFLKRNDWDKIEFPKKKKIWDEIWLFEEKWLR